MAFCNLALASFSFYLCTFSSLPGIPFPTLHPIHTPGPSLHDLGLFPHQILKGLAVSGQEDPLEKGMATYSSIRAWRMPWTEQSSGLQSMGRTELDTTECLHSGSGKLTGEAGFP